MNFTVDPQVTGLGLGAAQKMHKRKPPQAMWVGTSVYPHTGSISGITPSGVKVVTVPKLWLFLRNVQGHISVTL